MKSLDKARELAIKLTNRLNKAHVVMRTAKGDFAVERASTLETPFGRGLYPTADQLIEKVEPKKSC